MKGVIAAGNQYTAEAGAEILRRGGNAVDAAVAATYASFIAEITLVNMGGGGMATLHLAESETNISYDFFSNMPSGVYQQGVSDFKKILIDFGVAQQPFFIGRASAAVPGVVAGLCELAADHGTLPLPELLSPAIHLAEGGVQMLEASAYVAYLLTDILTATPESAAIFAPQGYILKVGDYLRMPALGAVLRQLGQRGQTLFYNGSIAAEIVADQQQKGGLITETDLANYKVGQCEPITISYRGYTILLPPPSSIGGVLIAFALRVLASVSFAEISYESSERLRILAETMRLTNVARANLHLTAEGIVQFLNQTHITKYQEMLQEVLAGGDPPAEPTFPKGANDTTHISVMDAAGNVAAITTSAGESAGFAVSDTGLLMNNMLGEIDLHPNGFHRAAPGSRLQTMMSPVVILAGKRPICALGSGGSTRLRSAILQVISNMLDYGFNLGAAVHAPRIHFEEGTLQIEGGNVISARAGLIRQGYWVNPWPGKNMYFGGVHSVGFYNRQFVGTGDSRRGGWSIVVD